jgi:chromosomal replication initiation ATPase DnaA
MQQNGNTVQKKYFPVLHALCQAALGQHQDALKLQIHRLAEALDEDALKREAEVLRGLLNPSTIAHGEMTPARLVRSRALAMGEELTPRTQPPVDKETSAPLAELVFPDQLPERSPFFDASVQDAIDSLVQQWIHHNELSAVGVTPANSALIYGAPGTGKTQLALWLAGSMGMPVVLARLDGLVSSFLGTTSRNIGTLFNFASRYRCVLMLDEFDAVAKLRDDPHEVGEIKRVVNTLLQNLDSRKDIGLTIAITNHEKLLDMAIWRRFEVQLAIPSPSATARVEILRRYLSALNLDDPHYLLMSWLTNGLSGSEIESLSNSLKRAYAINGINGVEFMPTVRQLTSLNAGRVDDERRRAMKLEPREFARHLSTETELKFDKHTLGVLFDRDKTTVSRWLNSSEASTA